MALILVLWWLEISNFIYKNKFNLQTNGPHSRFIMIINYVCSYVLKLENALFKYLYWKIFRLGIERATNRLVLARLYDKKKDIEYRI